MLKRIKMLKRITCIILIVLILSLLLNSCGYILVKEKAYYKNADNYIEITGIIKYLKLKDNELYFSVDSEDTHTIGVTFVIKGKNFKELKSIGFFDNTALDQTITFICAPEIMGDGYCPPVASVLTENGFVPEKEEGINNIVKEHSL